MSANDMQVGGDHYQMPIEPWDFAIANNLGYLEGNIVKYVTRYKRKGGIEDLQKARHYIEKLIEVEIENERLRAAHNTTTGTDKGNTIQIITSGSVGSISTISGEHYRSSEIGKCRIRVEGYGQPISLGDII